MSKTRRAIIITIVILIVVAALGEYSYQRERRQLEHSAQNDLAAICALKVDFATQWRHQLLENAQLLVTSPAVIGFSSSEGPEAERHMNEVLDWARINLEGYTSVVVIEPDQPLEDYGVLAPMIESARHGGVAEISDPYLDTQQRRRIAAISPIVEAGARPTGHVLLLTVDPTQSLFPAIARWPATSPTGEAMLVRRAGNSTEFLNPPRLLAEPGIDGQLLRSDLPAARAAAGAPMVPDMRLRDYRGIDVIAAWLRVPGSDWAVVAKLDADEVFAPLKTLWWMTWLAIFAVTALAAFGVLWELERRDATAEQQSAKTRFAEERLAVAVTATQIGMWEYDVATQRTYYSPEYKAQIGYHDDEMSSDYHEWDSRLHPADRERALAAVQAYVDNPTGLYSSEFRLRHKDGTYRNILSRGQGEVVGGRLVRMLGCHIDITSTKALEAQFRQAQKMEAVGRLAGGIAHDFNNMLTVITGYVDMLLEKSLPPDVARDLREVQRAGASAERLTRQLLVFSRTARQKSTQTDVNALIRNWQRLLGRTLGDNIAVKIDLCETPTVVDVDDEQIEQVIMNLAVNAKDAMPGGGTLTLRTDVRAVQGAEGLCTGQIQPGTYVVVSVEDAGTGIPADVLPHIFEPFFTTKDAGKGTGLGLATVHGIMTGHGGGVCVGTSPLGTRFHLYFPVATRVEPAKGIPVAGTYRTRHPRRVLVVDDDAAVRGVIAREIESVGHRVEAGDVDYAFNALRARRDFDLLVTDVVMPQLSGVELSQIFRERLPRLQTIFVTGYADAEITTTLPPNAPVLCKPLERGALRSAIESIELPAPASVGYRHAV